MSTSILLIHGFPHDHRLWAPQLTAFGPTYNVLAPDLRGFGAGGPVPEVIPMEHYAADMLALIDAQGTEKVVLCGLSMGGYVALAFLDLWPERVSALILCNTRATADTEEGKAARMEAARNALEKGMAVVARGMVPKMLCEKTRREQPDLTSLVESMMAEQPPAAVAAASRGMAQRPDRTAMLASISVPTLVITGDADELMPLPTSETMVAAIPGARLVVLPNAGHLSNLEAPDAFNATVSGFLSSLPHA